MKTRILAIDYGMKRIGLALSDESKIIASPIKTVLAEKKLEQTAQKIVDEIRALEKEKGSTIATIIIGNPLHMDGRVGVLADEVQFLIKHLKTLIETPIITWDERLTSVQAERALRESKMSRKKRTKSVECN